MNQERSDLDFEDNDNVIRWVPNARIWFDDNDNCYKAYDDDSSSLWAFAFEDSRNVGLSVDHLEGILREREGMSVAEAVADYFTTAMSRPYFEKRSFLAMKISDLRAVNLGLTKTPLLNRIHHCDIWPSAGNDNYVEGQYEHLSRSYSVLINNAAT